MRFNENELRQLADKRSTIHGTLQYLKPQAGDWSDWYQMPAYKERIFKLVQNCLFYYRPTDQDEPLGVFILEQMEVAYESPGPVAFAFSLTSNDGKHIFACRCQEVLNKWVAALKVASYTYWKYQHEVLKCKLAKLKGLPCTSPKTPSEQIMASQSIPSTFYFKSSPASSSPIAQNDNENITVLTKKMSKSTFYSQTETMLEKKIVSNGAITMEASNVPVDNLIDL